jgi:hypothetical protein
MDLTTLQSDPAMMIAAAVIALGLLGLIAESFFSASRRAASAKSPIKVTGNVPASAAAFAPSVKTAAAVEKAPEPVAKAEEAPAAVETAPVEPPKDPIAEQRRFFATLGAALNVDETAPVALAALHANLTSDVFMERMTLAAKGWRPDGFATGARELLLKAEGTPPDTVAEKVLEGYEQLKGGNVKDALEAFLAAIDAAKTVASADAGNPWPHAWSAFAWRGLALIAEEAGDVQATLAGLKVAYQSMLNAFEITMHGEPAAAAEAA